MNFAPLPRQIFIAMEGATLHLPERLSPDPAALQYHRENIFTTTEGCWPSFGPFMKHANKPGIPINHE